MAMKFCATSVAEGRSLRGRKKSEEDEGDEDEDGCV
jgi:hypothetical protein